MFQSGIMNYKGQCSRCRTMIKEHIFTFTDSIRSGVGDAQMIGGAM